MNGTDKKRELVIYDFCGTIADFQTGNAFVRYVLKHKGISDNRYEKLRFFLNKIGFIKRFNYIFPKMAVNKFLLLYQLKGLSYEELDKLAYLYYCDEVKPHLIEQVVDTIEKHRSEGALLVLDSAGYAIYLKYFTEEYNIPVLLASEFQYKNGIFTGIVEGKDNYGREKLQRLKQYFKTSEYSSDFSKVIGYSDSYSDMPVLEHCDKVVCVYKGPRQEKWMSDIGADIIRY